MMCGSAAGPSSTSENQAFSESGPARRAASYWTISRGSVLLADSLPLLGGGSVGSGFPGILRPEVGPRSSVPPPSPSALTRTGTRWRIGFRARDDPRFRDHGGAWDSCRNHRGTTQCPAAHWTGGLARKASQAGGAAATWRGERAPGARRVPPGAQPVGRSSRSPREGAVRESAAGAEIEVID